MKLTIREINCCEILSNLLASHNFELTIKISWKKKRISRSVSGDAFCHEPINNKFLLCSTHFLLLLPRNGRDVEHAQPTNLNWIGISLDCHAIRNTTETSNFLLIFMPYCVFIELILFWGLHIITFKENFVPCAVTQLVLNSLCLHSFVIMVKNTLLLN